MALRGLDLSVNRGERVALIGPNGAGKSTTAKLLCGILRPTGGTLEIGGLRPWAERRAHVRRIGVVFGQRTQLWWDLPVGEAFQLLGDIYSVPPADLRGRLDRLHAALGVGDLLARPVRELSLGQRMRCDLAAALLHGPELLILDEPTIGLDVDVKLRIRAVLRELTDVEGVTLILTTHDLSDVESVCDRVVLLDRGEALFDGPTGALRQTLGARRELLLDLSAPPPADVLSRLREGLPPGALDVVDGARLRIRFDVAERRAVDLLAAVSALLPEGLLIRELATSDPPIDDLVAAMYRGRSATP